MRVAILSRNSSLYSTSRLVEACEQRDHTVDVLNTLKCYMDIAAHRPSVHYHGKELAPVSTLHLIRGMPRSGSAAHSRQPRIGSGWEILLMDSVPVSATDPKGHRSQIERSWFCELNIVTPGCLLRSGGS